ncbi:phage tail tape measure protein [Bacillus sp. SRB_336]|nr:phage tail tape measure protein [Bacillus sp. SRB_336]
MAYANTIGILIAAKDEASAVIANAARNATAASAEATKTSAALSKVESSLTATGAAMTKSLTLPIVALAGVSAKMAYDFENKMELLHTNAGIAQSAIKGLSDQVLQMAAETGQAPDKLAEGLYHVASAGNGIWTAAQQMDILRVASEGANLGLANLDDTTYALTSAMASGVKGVSNASEMMAVLNATVGAGDMKMQDLNGALSTGILSTAATFGISIQSVGAALATLTDNGEHADEAATRLRMTLALMSSPSSQAAKQLQALGLTAEDAKNATGDMNKVFAQSGLTTTKLADDLRQPNGITVAIQDLKKHLEDAGLSASESDAMLSKAFGGGRTDAALLTMLQNTTRMDDKFKAINHDAGEMSNKLKDLDNSDPQKLRTAWASIQASFITIGTQVLPIAATALKDVAQGVSGVVTWFNGLDPVAKSVLGFLVATLAIGGPLLVGVGKFIGLVGDAKIALSFMGGVGSSAIGLITTGFGYVTETVLPGVMSAVTGLFSKIAAGGVMGGIATAGAIADIMLVYQAVQTVIGAINAMNAAAAAKQQLQQITNSNDAHFLDVAKNPIKYGAHAADLATQYLHKEGYPGYALGTNFAPGGLTMVGENGPELVNLPTGSKVSTAKQTQQMMAQGGDTHINITGNITIQSPEAATAFWDRIDKTQRLSRLGMA